MNSPTYSPMRCSSCVFIGCIVGLKIFIETKIMNKCEMYNSVYACLSAFIRSVGAGRSLMGELFVFLLESH